MKPIKFKGLSKYPTINVNYLGSFIYLADEKKITPCIVAFLHV